MKRPQFSIRLVLLITALVAVVITWRQAVDFPSRDQKVRHREHLQARLHELEFNRSAYLGSEAQVDREIAVLKAELEATKP